MDILTDVREAQMAWDRRFAGQREVPLLMSHRLGRRLRRLTQQLSCIGGYGMAATGRVVKSLFGSHLRASGGQTRRRKLSRECVYPA